jgi:uncharacterized BrkB/YihY/UPF0761 family membrane protein
MKFSNMKAGTRLGMGLAALIACLVAASAGCTQLDEVVNRITTENWERRG